MKLLKERCLEFSIYAMFFSSSLTASIKVLFYNTHELVPHIVFNFNVSSTNCKNL